MPRQDGHNTEPLSNEDFYVALTGIDFRNEGPRLRVLCAYLEPVSFLGSVSMGDTFTPIASSDGYVSHVRENAEAATDDNSASSRYFSLHTDGKYLPKVPEVVILHCVDPGTTEIPTVFVDTKDIMEVLRVTDRLEEARGYDLVFRNKDGVEFVRPLIETNPTNGEQVMNIAIGSPQCHLRPHYDNGRSQEDADHFYGQLEKITEQDIPKLSHQWKKNDAIIFDNLRLIHGRGLPEHKTLTISDIQRHLHRIWLNRK